MIRPVDFKYNTQTADNNKFQQASVQTNVQEQALQEFDGFVDRLRAEGVDVRVIDDTLQPETPDSIFPNNWISFHQDGQIVLYPMFSENRRAERRNDIIDSIKNQFSVQKTIDLSAFENREQYLEGTGSMVLDREAKIAYACLSQRTDAGVLNEFCSRTGYRAVLFHAQDAQGFPIYHTNVMMCVASHFSVVCLESIPDKAEQEMLIKSLTDKQKPVISIDFMQMNHFAGNMLEVQNVDGEKLLVMSEQAYLSLRPDQVAALSAHCRIVYVPLYTIEKNGGGSARCMLAEIHLPLHR